MKGFVMHHRLMLLMSSMAFCALCFSMSLPSPAHAATRDHLSFAVITGNGGAYNAASYTPDHGQTWQGTYITSAARIRMATGAGTAGRFPYVTTGVSIDATQTQAYLSNFPLGTDSRDPALHDETPLHLSGNCQQGAGLTTGAKSSYVVVCASPPANGTSRIAINVGGDTLSQWGGWQVIGGWSGLSNTTQVPIPSVIFDGTNLQILAQSPTDGSLWTATYMWGGSVQTWHWLGKTTCTSTPLLATRPGGSPFSVACIAGDRHTIWANTFTPGSTPSLGIWRFLGMAGGGFTDIALTADPQTPNGTIYVSGLGSDHTVYTLTATNTLTYPSQSAWQRDFTDPNLIGIASSYS